MDDVLTLCAGLPTRTFEAGEVLLVEGSSSDAILVLERGAVEVRKEGAALLTIDAPGAFLGEISALLGTPRSADVVAVAPTEVRVIEDPAAALTADPQLVLAIARLLAHRLRASTSYLADLKQQYGGAGGHLALMDQVLSELTAMRTTSLAPGSEREDVPDY
jgi:CRP/FNR family transcriptional regulator, cyclic AMP receptor protein